MKNWTTGVKCYISLEAVNANLLTTVLEEKLHTRNFQVMPDNSVKLFDFWTKGNVWGARCMKMT